MSKLFNSVPKIKVPKSVFNLSHERKASFKFGQLIPILVEEVIPGDNFKISSETMIRFAPMISPVMHRINAYVHYFFVPNRILWDDWESFITGEQELQAPTINVTNQATIGSIYDHFGLPITQDAKVVSSLPFRAYNSIYNEYYRDQNLTPKLHVKDGDDPMYFGIMKRSWQKDYFTSALPWAQKGGEANLSLPVQYDFGHPVFVKDEDNNTINDASTFETSHSGYLEVETRPAHFDYAGASEAEININDLRTANKLQRWLERNAKFGTRYIEHLLRFGVRSRDARLDRPEYIGGGKSPVVISEVLNTTGTENSPFGDMAGHGINVGNSNQAKYFCEEHGWIIGILSVMPVSSYYQGMPKKFMRRSNLDYPFPEFARLGEQEVYKYELFWDPLTNDSVFGYQSRYAELKYGQSSVHGDFRQNLEFWHMGRKFSECPTLSQSFVELREEEEELDRIFAVQDRTDYLWAQIYNHVIAKRPLPFNPEPSL